MTSTWMIVHVTGISLAHLELQNVLRMLLVAPTSSKINSAIFLQTMYLRREVLKIRKQRNL